MTSNNGGWTGRPILVAKSGTLRDVDKANLRKAGVLIVETDYPSDVRLMEGQPISLPAGAIMRAAGAAISSSGVAQQSFGAALAREMANANPSRGEK